ncbi:hypothetical protein LZ31DRAFT_20790 [Colletotrichum somersetense]|nr:hypothetical protein LZ31DRAFT_20790 [Colletotrichum somersetense]
MAFQKYGRVFSRVARVAAKRCGNESNDNEPIVALLSLPCPPRVDRLQVKCNSADDEGEGEGRTKKRRWRVRFEIKDGEGVKYSSNSPTSRFLSPSTVQPGAVSVYFASTLSA